MSEQRPVAAPVHGHSPRRVRGLRASQEALELLSSVADGYAKTRLFLALVTVIAGALLAALTPVALKLVVDALTERSTAAAGSVLVPLGLAAMYCLGQYLVRCSGELRTMLHGQAEQRIRRNIAQRLFEHVVRLPIQAHLDRKAGAVGEAVEQGLRGFDVMVQHAINTIVPVCIEFSVVAVVLLSLDSAQYLVILALAATGYFFAFRSWSYAVHDPSDSASSLQIEARAVLTDALVNQEVIKYFNAEAIVCRRYGFALRRTEFAWRNLYRTHSRHGIAVASVFGSSLTVCMILATRDVMSGSMTVGDLVLVNAYVLRLVQPVELLGFAVRDITQGLAFLRAMLSLLREQTEADRSDSSSPPLARPCGLEFRNVSFSYHKGRTALQNISFAIPAGKTVAVVGVSGSGKSSLIRLLFCLYEPGAGQILLDGLPMESMPLSNIRRAIAVVPQDTVLFHDTIAANIAFGKPEATRHEIETVARIANLHDFIVSLPEGYETIVGERGLKLSGGERQRVAIARAALKQPRLLVFDEATSSLDSRTEREILRNLFRLSAQCTTLMVAHRLSTVVHADEILVLHLGTIVERGRHEELCARNGHYAALWRAQHGATVQGPRLSQV